MKQSKLAIALILSAPLFNLAHAYSTASVSAYGMDLDAPVGASDTYFSGTPGSTIAVVDLPSFVAPLGLPDWPAENYPAVYTGYASANDTTGTLKAYVKAQGMVGDYSTSVPSRYVTATASGVGNYIFTGNDDHTVQLQYDGTFSDPALAGFPAFATLSLTACALVSDSMSGCKTQSVNLNSDLNGVFNAGKLSLVIAGESGDSFQIQSSMSVTAWANWTRNSFAEAAFHHTAQLDFVLPVGASIQGENGFLSSVPVSFAAPVPEPESYVMFLAGLGLLGTMARRRKVL